MPEMPLPGRLRTAAALLCAILVSLSWGSSMASPAAVHHRLDITLVPAEQKLIGRDRMRIQNHDRGEIPVSLSDRARVLQVSVNGAPRPFRPSTSGLVVPLEPREQVQGIDLDIRYEASFKDPVPIDPVNTDNPGFGVMGSIGEKGTFLLSGAGWHPEIPGSRATYRVRVQAPATTLAVTAGRSLGHRSAGGETVSEWLVEHPVEGLSLSAGPYEVHESRAGDVAVSLYLFRESRDLAPAYLDAAAEAIRFYSNLFGPYPFPKFAVVENFFPTGYGFPSYTLIGGTVLRLPFIIRTSLAHEIAHCWWGNGVHVDYEAGNWVEGLTTYVSDYLLQERGSVQEAKDYRLQAIRSYSTLAPPGADFPLSGFSGRTDPLTKAVGYDKGAMVFHMLRRTLGEEPFWNGLRDLYRERLFLETSWGDLQAVFERRANRPLEGFFSQWVHRKGAPRIRLQNVHAAPEKGGWRVEAQVVQDPPFFETHASVLLECGETTMTRDIPISGPSTPLRMGCPTPPIRLTIDPDFHLLRRLDDAETPPSINRLKSSPSVLLVLPGEGGGAWEPLAGTLAEALGLERYRVVPEATLERSAPESGDAIFVGLPRNRRLLPSLPPPLRLQEDRFTLEGRDYKDPSDAFFGVFPHPSGGDRVAALFLPLSTRGAGAAARKVAHYGRYSYVAFRDGVNREKGFWPVVHSPVVHNWETERWNGGIME